MKTVTSISKFEKELPSSGSRPVVIWCNDINYYVCKYGKVNDLFNEYLAASFCEIWDIPVPNFCFVKVKPEHVPEGYSKKSFEKTCYGSFYLEYAKDVNAFLTTWGGNSYELNKIVNQDVWLKIGLFDLWLSNEDRNHNNANLLINSDESGYKVVAIDHVNIFNTSSLERGLYQLNEDDSIILTDYTKMFFKRGVKLNELTDNLEKSFYVYTRKCLRNLKRILSKVPADWNIDVLAKETLIRQYLFNNEWEKQTIESFRFILEKQLLKE